MDAQALLSLSATSFQTPRHTVEFFSLKETLIENLKSRGYVKFLGHYKRYKAQRIGESYCYQVPATKRGHLQKFRNRLIRVVCIGSGSYTMREFMAGPM